MLLSRETTPVYYGELNPLEEKITILHLFLYCIANLGTVPLISGNLKLQMCKIKNPIHSVQSQPDQYKWGLTP